MINEEIKNKTKGNVTIRCRAGAAEKLDLHLATYPHLKEPEVVAEALNYYFETLAKAPLASHEANKVKVDKLEMPAAITSG